LLLTAVRPGCGERRSGYIGRKRIKKEKKSPARNETFPEEGGNQKKKRGKKREIEDKRRRGEKAIIRILCRHSKVYKAAAFHKKRTWRRGEGKKRLPSHRKTFGQKGRGGGNINRPSSKRWAE